MILLNLLKRNNCLLYTSYFRSEKSPIYAENSLKSIFSLAYALYEIAIEKIFNRSYTLSDTNKNYESSGLGLAISKNLANGMNSDILVKSIPQMLLCWKMPFPIRQKRS